MSKQKSRILIIDDEPSVRESLQGILEDEGYQIFEAESGENGLEQLTSAEPDLILLDILMPDGIDGLETLRRIKQISPDTPVILMSGHATLDLKLADQLGAVDFVSKPFSIDDILLRVARGLESRPAHQAQDELQKQLEARYQMVGESAVIQRIRQVISQVAPTQGRVLITGESGTGKELVARAIHNQSPRSGKPFVQMNCAAIPKELIEAELFGYEKGAFTGATDRRAGKFERADGGTLFLDEVGDMSLDTQAKVLRVLETQTFERIGGKRTLEVDARVIAATNKDLQKEIQEGNFRDDLYYRLNVVPIHVAPLRERREDIPTLVQRFLYLICRENNVPLKEISSEALRILQSYSWPGNIRELRNMVERLVILSVGERIEVDDIPFDLDVSAAIPGAEAGGLREARALFERDFILRSLENHHWNITETALELGIERTNLHRKMRQLGIKRADP